MLGHLGLREPEDVDELPDRALAGGEHVEDLPAPGLGDRVERVRRGRCACHAEHHIPIWEYIKDDCARNQFVPAAYKEATRHAPLPQLPTGDGAPPRAPASRRRAPDRPRGGRGVAARRPPPAHPPADVRVDRGDHLPRRLLRPPPPQRVRAARRRDARHLRGQRARLPDRQRAAADRRPRDPGDDRRARVPRQRAARQRGRDLRDPDRLVRAGDVGLLRRPHPRGPDRRRRRPRGRVVRAAARPGGDGRPGRADAVRQARPDARARRRRARGRRPGPRGRRAACRARHRRRRRPARGDDLGRGRDRALLAAASRRAAPRRPLRGHDAAARLRGPRHARAGPLRRAPGPPRRARAAARGRRARAGRRGVDPRRPLREPRARHRPPTTSRCRAARTAEEIHDREPSLLTTQIVGQIRSVAVDLVRAAEQLDGGREGTPAWDMPTEELLAV